MSDVNNYSTALQSTRDSEHLSVTNHQVRHQVRGEMMLMTAYHGLKRLTFIMHVMSGITLLGMMLTTLADVMTRAIFHLTQGHLDLTFVGSIEFIKYGLLVAIFFTLPYALSRSQVIVDLFTDSLTTRIKSCLEGIYMLGFMLMGVGMSYRFFLSIEEVHLTGETTQDLLIPLTYFYGLTCFATAVLAVSALCEAIRLFVFGREEAPR